MDLGVISIYVATAATGVDVNAARVGEQRTSKLITVM